MKKFIQEIFKQAEYKELSNNKSEMLVFASDDDKKMDYYIVYFIDATGNNNTPDSLRAAFDSVEAEFIGKSEDNIGIKRWIQEQVGNKERAAAVDKNTSIIFVVRLDSMENMDLYRNLFFGVEDSTSYYRRYVLPYTEKQLEELSAKREEKQTKIIEKLLCMIADSEEGYKELASDRNTEELYGLVIRLFCKIPVLSYHVEGKNLPDSIETEIVKKMPDALKEYHKLVADGQIELESLLKLDTNNYEAEITRELDAFLQEV